MVDAPGLAAQQFDLLGHRRLATQLHARRGAHIGREGDAQQNSGCESDLEPASPVTISESLNGVAGSIVRLGATR
jgi:hypothetical protein